MAKQLFANNATSMLSGILTQGGNALVCSNGEGNRFPSPAADEYFLLTIYTKDAYANEQKVEVVKVTSRAGDTLMIERDVELLTGQSGGYACFRCRFSGGFSGRTRYVQTGFLPIGSTTVG